MHVTWSVETNPLYTLTLTLRREDMDALYVLIRRGADGCLLTSAQPVARVLTDAIREATAKEK